MRQEGLLNTSSEEKELNFMTVNGSGPLIIPVLPHTFPFYRGRLVNETTLNKKPAVLRTLVPFDGPGARFSKVPKTFRA